MKILLLIFYLAVVMSEQELRKENSANVFHIEPILNFDDAYLSGAPGENNKVRCTRRYTPGYCPGLPVQSVWTYMTFYQNCTERMGCPTERNVNRFQSYAECLMRCRQMNILYSHALSKYYNEPRANETRNDGDDENDGKL